MFRLVNCLYLGGLDFGWIIVEMGHHFKEGDSHYQPQHKNISNKNINILELCQVIEVDPETTTI